MPKVKVTKDTLILGVARKSGDTIELTTKQAETYARRGFVEVLKPKASDIPEGSPASMSAVEIRAKLDELKVAYPANANKATLVELLTGALQVPGSPAAPAPDPLA